eukprot:2890011-Prymnesium_polylepis.2
MDVMVAEKTYEIFLGVCHAAEGGVAHGQVRMGGHRHACCGWIGAWRWQAFTSVGIRHAAARESSGCDWARGRRERRCTRRSVRW